MISVGDPFHSQLCISKDASSYVWCKRREKKTEAILCSPDPGFDSSCQKECRTSTPAISSHLPVVAAGKSPPPSAFGQVKRRSWAPLESSPKEPIHLLLIYMAFALGSWYLFSVAGRGVRQWRFQVVSLGI